MRAVCWFSCGAASAVAAKLATNKYGDSLEVVYCNTMVNEHPDNRRFFQDVQAWLGRKITVISSPHATTLEQVFETRRYMSGPQGACCTVVLKKEPRFAFQRVDDTHIFGYTADEVKRIKSFEANNPELKVDWILRSKGYTKTRVFEVLREAGIELPVMYALGFKNNNCIGCVKASSPKYWNLVRRLFPEVFHRRAVQSRAIGARLTRVKVGKRWQRIFLDELPIDLSTDFEEDLSCGPECQR